MMKPKEEIIRKTKAKTSEKVLKRPRRTAIIVNIASHWLVP